MKNIFYQKLIEKKLTANFLIVYLNMDDTLIGLIVFAVIVVLILFAILVACFYFTSNRDEVLGEIDDLEEENVETKKKLKRELTYNAKLKIIQKSLPADEKNYKNTFHYKQYLNSM